MGHSHHLSRGIHTSGLRNPPEGEPRNHHLRQGLACTCCSRPLQELLTLPQECFAPFNHFTCPLSAQGAYSALTEIHLP